MSKTVYIAHDDRGIQWPINRERAARLSRAGLTVTARTVGESNE